MAINGQAKRARFKALEGLGSKHAQPDQPAQALGLGSVAGPLSDDESSARPLKAPNECWLD